MGLDCEIVFSDNAYNPTKNYYPGQSLNGIVTIISDSERKVKGLKVRICGGGAVKFIERESRPVVTEHHDHSNLNFQSNSQSSLHSHNAEVDVEYKSEEIYLDCTLNIFGFSGVDYTIKPGRFTHPFNFVLPHGLPSSFEGEFGSVRYSVEAVVGQSWWKFDCKSMLTFRVVGIVDLNNEPSAQLPIISKASKKFGVIFLSGPLDITLKLPKGGAVPGENLQFVAEIFNKSDKTVTEAIYIKQDIYYYAQEKNKMVSKIVLEKSGEVLKPGADHIWTENCFQLPLLPPTGLGNCRIIDVQYKLVLEMKVSGLAFNLSASSPIVIGTVPFRSVAHSDPPPPYTPHYDALSITKSQVEDEVDDFVLT